MRKLAVAALAVMSLMLPCRSKAQVGSVATYTWIGGGPNTVTNGAEFSTIDGTVTNQAIGFAGTIEFTGYGSALQYFTLPEPGTCSIPRNPDGTCSGEEFPTFPNNGFLGNFGPLVFGPKQWGTRIDGTPMDGTKAGDSYTLSATTTATLWNGSVAISFTEFREMIAHRSCVRYGCHTYLSDTMESGYGTAEVTQ